MDRLIPSRGLGIYAPRLWNDSTLADLKNRLIVKLDTTSISVGFNRANHHELGFQFPALKLKGQRLQFSFKPDTLKKDSSKALSKSEKIIATFTLADTAKIGALKFKQDPSAFGSHLILRSLSSPTEFSLLTPAKEEFIWDSLPEGWYAAHYFRDANGDGIWNPGSLAPWNVQEPYVAWSDSVQVNPKTDSTGRKLAWPPRW